MKTTQGSIQLVLGAKCSDIVMRNKKEGQSLQRTIKDLILLADELQNNTFSIGDTKHENKSKL